MAGLSPSIKTETPTEEPPRRDLGGGGGMKTGKMRRGKEERRGEEGTNPV